VIGNDGGEGKEIVRSSGGRSAGSEDLVGTKGIKIGEYKQKKHF